MSITQRVVHDSPGSTTEVARVGEAQWLPVAWAWWVDLHRDNGLRL